ncbi:MAG: hypothetical protein ABH952_12505 [Candidatus Omnitrophota bacterium]
MKKITEEWISKTEKDFLVAVRELRTACSRGSLFSCSAVYKEDNKNLFQSSGILV